MRLSRIESALRRQGIERYCGVDEAGRGPLAGPVVAAAVILPPKFHAAAIDDSKKLSEAQRESAYAHIVSKTTDWAVAVVAPAIIDEINILKASLRAMHEAVTRLAPAAEFVLVDGNRPIPGLALAQQTIVGGDAQIVAIAAASIIAKVTRDRIMREYHEQFPKYGFDRHKGYPTFEHRQMIALHGPTEIHRRSFCLVPEQFELALTAEDAASL